MASGPLAHPGLHNHVVLARLGPITVVWFGVLAAIGGGSAMLWIFARLFTLLDCFVLGLPLAHAIGRLGCHCYGCCHGRPTGSRLAIRYTHPDSKVVWGSGLGGVPLHPTQLYSAAGNLALFAVLNLVALSPHPPGLLAASYLLLGSAGRFGTEFLRGIPTRRLLGLSSYQQLCLALFACGLVLLVRVWGATPSSALAGLEPALSGLGQALRHAWYPGLVFAVGLAGFGVQGARVGGRCD